VTINPEIPRERVELLTAYAKERPVSSDPAYVERAHEEYLGDYSDCIFANNKAVIEMEGYDFDVEFLWVPWSELVERSNASG
jgi:hypothetical protein